MKRIQILPEEVCNKIAAGEVIDHPTSILRELLDNSIDSNATSIHVRLFEDSLEEFSLEVMDNGCGIHPEDLSNAFVMHATSKIRLFEDIYQLQTMGFRGEALSSIASISHIQITSSTEDTGNGFSVSCTGGKTTNVVCVPAQRGTKVSVSKIFFNTPARKKFLSGRLLNKNLFRQDFVRKALAFENIGFFWEIISKGKLKQDVHVPQGATFGERISLLFSERFDQILLEVDVTEQREIGKVSMHGYVSNLQIRNRTRRDQFFFVRGRYVQNAFLYKSIQSAYMTFLSQKFYPSCFLKIMCEPNMVDVNVHPTKKDVRFEDNDSIYSLVYQSIKKTLASHVQVRLFPSEIVDTDMNQGMIVAESIFSDRQQKSFLQENDESTTHFQEQVSDNRMEMKFSIKNRSDWTPILSNKPDDSQPLLLDEESTTVSIRIVGQYRNTYIIFEKDSNLLMCDQHGLHERMLFEQYQEKFTQGIEKQILLIPYIVPFVETDQEMLIQNNHFLDILGFEVENFGDGLCKVESVPFVLGYTWSENSVKDLLELVLDNLGQSAEEVTRRISTSLSCWNAIKSGEILPDWKSLELVSNFYKNGYAATCPHGRPIIKEWSELGIKKYFHRDYPS